MTKEVRTRFAPSPTGTMHIGNLRTAIYTYLIAKKDNGKFVLRIEDTDQERLVEGATKIIYDTLKMFNLVHDEGPDVGGPYKPYIQSERKDTYLPYAKQLIEEGHAYYCFCSKERIDNLRTKAEENKVQFKYDRHCLNLTKEEITKKIENEPYVIRQLMPDTGELKYQDDVFGTLSFDNTILEDQVLIKSDGFPTYNFANVIDDHLMDITHIVRGSEYLSSTPKYIHLYNAFKWDVPTFVHLPLIVLEGGKKISKRTGDGIVSILINNGYLPEAILNALALLGWSHGDEKEFFTLDELIKEFGIKGISKSPSLFDEAKLRWINSEYIKNMTDEQFHTIVNERLKNVLTQKLDTKKIAKILHKRTEVLTDIENNVDFLNEVLEYDKELYFHKKMKCDYEVAVIVLPQVISIFEKLTSWDHDAIYQSLVNLANNLEYKNGKVMWPVRVALTGKSITPGGAIDIADILGKDITIKRLKDAMDKLEKN
ncbi:MAG: glutamate--tRNA ligase [Clostridiales bacterium]|nr:glutamate--tRNA ligase [Clostridiales bacterium]